MTYNFVNSVPGYRKHAQNSVLQLRIAVKKKKKKSIILMQYASMWF